MVTRLLVSDPLSQFDLATVALDRPTVWKAVQGSHWRVSFRSPRPDDSLWALELGLRLGRCTVVCDEVDWVSKAAAIEEPLRRMICYGRHAEVDFLAGARRPADTPRLLTSQADRLALFRITEPRDLDYVAEFAGRELADRLPRLEVGEVVIYEA